MLIAVALPPKLMVVAVVFAIGNVAALVVIPFVLLIATAFVEIVNPANVGVPAVPNPVAVTSPELTPFVVKVVEPCPEPAAKVDPETIPAGVPINPE